MVFLLLLLSVPAAAKNLLVVAWDGAGLIKVNELLSGGRLPNLKAFLDSGALLCPIELDGQTNTVTSWTRFWTGLDYSQTAVLGNRRFEDMYAANPDIVSFFKRMWPKFQIYGTIDFWVEKVPYVNTVPFRLQQTGVKIGWTVAKPGFLGSKETSSPICLIAQNADYFAAYAPGVYGDSYIDLIVADALKFMSDNPAPSSWMVFAHLNPDYYGHRHGACGERYLREFERADTALGQLLAAVDPATTRVIVVSDHGFSLPCYTNHPDAPDAWIATNLPVNPIYVDPARGTMRDVALTMLHYYGVEWSGFTPKPRGKSLLAPTPPPETTRR